MRKRPTYTGRSGLVTVVDRQHVLAWRVPDRVIQPPTYGLCARKPLRSHAEVAALGSGLAALAVWLLDATMDRPKCPDYDKKCASS